MVKLVIFSIKPSGVFCIFLGHDTIETGKMQGMVSEQKEKDSCNLKNVLCQCGLLFFGRDDRISLTIP